MEKKSGIVGFTGAFRENVKEIENGSTVVFTGSVAVCTPFIELLAYSIRDKDLEMIYVPKSDIDQAKMIKEQPNIGFSVVDQKADPQNPEVVVVMGGLAMPKFGCAPEDVVNMLDAISGDEKPKVIGVCFMDIFKRVGWTKKIPFDVVIDTTLETVVTE
ncbi:DUF2124 family protein [Methanobacterium petrolearium]|uniref:DUF2124 family protein n=1 Tax=Methanobacterium petrolearium TaxID=710190 RepID=UPI001AE31F58|nr:DUF2124 family protein [Methanobacterium petrolearium]MBP1947073.1 hypothetical protein [Methanobacterium petrolearium]BDZ69688.1 hypothetical protein GCM10025861_02050 [Methanobacterium petrolearium]